MVFDKGRPIDSKLSEDELQRSLKLEEHAHVLDRYMAEIPNDGTYGWQGTLGRNGSITVPKASLKDQISAAERASRVRERINRREPPILISYDLATDTPIFAEEDMEAYEDGYICPGCLQYQSVPNPPTCTWLRNEALDGHVDERDRGCGHRNYDR